ncbi:hypothetical protein H072_9783 [Dactylellina haptotyla CBS 200.50]|uniref:Uncharacterized protein n=1 Tax=Dactylellina haptotyla (strain CBS 200.50) TaxID=1284197 RepID=S8BN37_DACHA|nr:hypothetical protein H072_9783 [Dactylellina haptotyla CBS 200.50]
MDEFPQPPKSQVAFDENAMKAERKKQKKQAKLTKAPPAKTEGYHHTPTFAAQSFTMTATPDAFLRNQTRKRPQPLLDMAKRRRAPSPHVIQPFDDRSSGEYDRSSLKTPTRDGPSSRSPKFPAPQSNRFMASPHYELFSSTILNQTTPGTTGRRTPNGDSYTRGRPDWSEMDEKVSNKNLRRTNSTVSSKSSKSQRRQRPQSTDLSSVLKGNGVLRIPKDDESIYQGRGCVPWRIRV